MLTLMSNDILFNLLSFAIRSGNMTDLRCFVQQDSSVALKSFSYSYTMEYGSDGCWDMTKTNTMTVGKFLLNGISNHGNRAYNFALVKVDA